MANREVIEKWVAALESGEYQQVEGALRKDDGFCCLGVLCELAVEANVIEPAEHNGEDWLYDEIQGSLPEPVWNWAGVGDEDPFLRPLKPLPGETVQFPVAASGWNDTYGKTFPEIAAMIRHTFLENEQ